jgi:hypothetical protein
MCHVCNLLVVILANNEAVVPCQNLRFLSTQPAIPLKVRPLPILFASDAFEIDRKMSEIEMSRQQLAGQGWTLKLRALEVPPEQSTFSEDPAEDVALVSNVTGCDCGGVNTLTLTSATVAISSAVTTAVSLVPFTNVVTRAVPFHLMVESRSKWFPLTMSVNDALPTVALVGVTDAIAGVSTQSPQEMQPKPHAITRIGE